MDDRTDNDLFDRKAAELRSEQFRVMREMEAHRNANQTYVEEGIRLLDLVRRAHVLFENQLTAEKRKRLILYSRTAGGKPDSWIQNAENPFICLQLSLQHRAPPERRLPK
jgi:hypothetical protein